MGFESIRSCNACYLQSGVCSKDMLDDFAIDHAKRNGYSPTEATRWISYRANEKGRINRCIKDDVSRPFVGQVCQALVQINLPTENKITSK